MKSIIIAAAVLFSFAATSRAQFITWESPDPIDGPSNIATNGTYVDALQTHGSYTDGTPLTDVSVTNPTTGVATEFNIYTSSTYIGGSPGNLYQDGTFSITADDDNGGDGSGSDATPYQKVLDHVTFTGAIGTVTMNGLTPGNEYQIQIWNAAGFRATSYTSGTNVVDTNGQYVIGTFTAGAASIGSLTSSESFTYTPINGNGAGEINALSLRDLSAVPEPSTYAMMLAGLALMGLGLRGRVLLN